MLVKLTPVVLGSSFRNTGGNLKKLTKKSKISIFGKNVIPSNLSLQSRYQSPKVSFTHDSITDFNVGVCFFSQFFTALSKNFNFFFKIQLNSVITITVITNSRLKRKKFVWFFGPKWILYYTNLHGYSNVTVSTNKYWRSRRVRYNRVWLYTEMKFVK